MMRRIKNIAAFTVIEVVMALGVFALAASAILPSVTHQMQVNRDDELMMKAILAAKNKMTEIESEIQTDMEKNNFPDNVSKAGKFEGVYEGMSWEYAIRKVEIPISGDSLGEANPMAANILKQVMKDISKAVRELKLTVRWWDDEDEEKDRAKKELVLTTHVVNFKQK